MSFNAPISPKLYARNAGLLYLVIILVGMFSVIFVRDGLIVSGDPAATARNLAAHQLLWRAGIAADLVMHLCDVPVMLVIFVLLRPVDKNIALLALLFNLVQTAVLVANKLNLVAALQPLGNAAYLKAFTPGQLDTQMYLSIKLHDIGFGIGLIFFGFTCLVNGYLVFRSGYFPRIIGILLQVAGCCYIIGNFLLLLAPEIAAKLFPASMLPCFIAELTFCLWLIFKGVDINVWNKRVSG
jgi:hypothetical protein